MSKNASTINAKGKRGQPHFQSTQLKHPSPGLQEKLARKMTPHKVTVEMTPLKPTSSEAQPFTRYLNRAKGCPRES